MIFIKIKWKNKKKTGKEKKVKEVGNTELGCLFAFNGHI